MKIHLPDLKTYKLGFLERGINIPLPVVPFSETGLLAQLPSPPASKIGWPWTVETNPDDYKNLQISNAFNYPKISIVTPCYQQGQFLEETIRSVLLQNYPNLEFIVFDGDSNDDTKGVLEKYSPWLSFWQSEKDRGQGHAINLGFSIASGDYFGWINSDDFYLPSCLYKVINKFLDKNKEFVYGDAIELNETNGNINYWQGYYVLDKYLIVGGIIASHSAFWQSKIHVPIWEDINCAIDYEFWLRMLPSKSKVHIKEPLGLCRIQNQSKSFCESYKSSWEEDYKKIFNAYKIHKYKLSWTSRELGFVHRLYKFMNKKSIENIAQFTFFKDLDRSI